MRFCMDHWSKLRRGIEDRGLFHLVAKNGEVATENLIKELNQDNDEKSYYDPLMAAHWAIINNALNFGVLYLLNQKEDGTEYCPICEAVSHNASDEMWWIDNACNEQLKRAQDLGLIKIQ